MRMAFVRRTLSAGWQMGTAMHEVRAAGVEGADWSARAGSEGLPR